ncbi:hypothetical protein CHLRE_02g105650v5 [Chlamydomonas reinhardtii]|uniref:Uncharacterized protein n=1 Tax=Chlamydomonas reinhardtii TaxID=3055 RepID=A0A2K3E2M0_CHLRE|nr:uncharacterized protein CHLRE_02g105650v5 [Chlamydomonas reinhardtii]PNW87025.1 hypothetical protein CHLRE_02g105650v5 [Chlamydomonas reinhardtii]
MQTCFSPNVRLARPGALRSARTSSLVVVRSKGFGSETAKQKEAEAEASTSKPSGDGDAAALEALEARIKSRRKGRVEPKVKVNAPAVDVATGKAPVDAASEAEQSYLTFLSIYFIWTLVLGLALAGAGFLPEAMDIWIQDNLYPNYSWVILGFLGLSSLYGLYKTGKLPGQIQKQ